MFALEPLARYPEQSSTVDSGMRGARERIRKHHAPLALSQPSGLHILFVTGNAADEGLEHGKYEKA